MPRMRILSATEQEQLGKPPIFDSYQRKKSFDFPKSLLETAQGLRKPGHQIGFLLACGYFNTTKRFFAPRDYYNRDIDYVAHRLNIQFDSFDSVNYTNRTRQRHEHIILEYYGFKWFDSSAESLISCEIFAMIRTQLKPKLIFWLCLDILNQHHIQLPNSRRISDLIRIRLNQRKRELARLIEQNISPQTRETLENLFV